MSKIPGINHLDAVRALEKFLAVKLKKTTREIIMFDTEELEILDALESLQLKRNINSEEECALARKAAQDYLSQSKNITICLNLADVTAIKRRSQELGIPYQTIISSLVHQYANGKIRLEAG